MKIRIENDFEQSLLAIIDYIAADKKSAAIKFKKELQEKLSLTKNQPYMNRKSYYFKDEAYRDLIHYGYTVVYKVSEDYIIVLDIFKWIDR